MLGVYVVDFISLFYGFKLAHLLECVYFALCGMGFGSGRMERLGINGPLGLALH